MKSSKRLADIPPLAIGRATRVVFGIGTLLVIGVVGWSSLGIIGTVLLAALGLSFLVGGLAGNPGCEITAIPNLLLPRSKRVHYL